MTILVVDDEESILLLLQYNLERAGYTVLKASRAADAIKIARASLPDLIILDIMLPDMSGLDVCRVLKGDEATRSIHIIMLTARDTDADEVQGLLLGADDYVCKPFSPRVLLARIKAVLRRDEGSNISTTLTVGDLTIDTVKYEANYRGAPVGLSATEFAILKLLAQNRGRVYTRPNIIASIKGEDYPVSDRAIDVQILSIRRKLEAVGLKDFIHTVRGVGYRVD